MQGRGRRVMKSTKTGQKAIRTHRAPPRRKRRVESSTGKASDLSSDTLSSHALIEILRGSCKGKSSLVAAREREHRRDEQAKSRKQRARD